VAGSLVISQVRAYDLLWMLGRDVHPTALGGAGQALMRALGSLSVQFCNRYVTVLCGDFNAGPDAAEIRMLTGRSAGDRD
jgi:hypothetical protein